MAQENAYACKVKVIQTSILGVSLVLASYIGSNQITHLKPDNKIITVRGSAEIPVQADVVTWSLRLTSADNVLTIAQQNMAASLKSLNDFLIQQGVPASDIETETISVNDAMANQYSQVRGARYSISSGLIINTSNLEAVQKAKANMASLLTQNIILAGSTGPNYTYTKLNEDKPKLIADATKAARTAAERLALDAGLTLGPIRTARQGNVEVSGRDRFRNDSEQPNKTLRVVTTVDYEIK